MNTRTVLLLLIILSWEEKSIKDKDLISSRGRGELEYESDGDARRLDPHPDWSLLGVLFKISDEHPRRFHIGVPPPDISC